MSVVRYFSLREIYARIQEFAVLQNMKGRAVYRFRFFLSPLPKRAQHCSRAASKVCRTADAPKFIFIANPIHRCLLDSALT